MPFAFPPESVFAFAGILTKARVMLGEMFISARNFNAEPG